MARTRILIVEDEVLIAEDIRGQLLGLGYEVVGMTNSGEKAVRLAEALQPDLILMDVSLMGSMNGFEAGRLIETSLGGTVIYVSANPRANQLPRSIPKPFTNAVLASAVAQALGNRADPTL